MSLFNASEVLQFAITIEENGETFYRKLAQKIDNPHIKILFSQLADEEVKHKAIFQKFLETIEIFDSYESYPTEYFSYLRAYADKLVFDFAHFEDTLQNIRTAAQAFHFAIQKEFDTILYFQETKRLVIEQQQKHIDKIIEEERGHVIQLNALRKELEI